MKNIILLLVFFLTSLGHSQTNEIRVEVKEFNIGKNKEKIKIEKIYRGKQLLVTSMVKNGKKSRVFNFAKELNCAESDEDGDGFMETFIIYNNKSRQVEAFRRDKNGNVKVDSSMAEKFKENLGTIDSLLSLIGSKKERR